MGVGVSMRTGDEFKSNWMAKKPIFRYIPEKDRYLLGMDRPKYRVNCIGTGLMGMEHMSITMFEGRAYVHGLYDTSPLSMEKAKEMFHHHFPGIELIVYDSLEEACNDPSVDALIICTPNHTHLDVVKVAAESGKHILLEKPIATTIEDAYEIKKIAENHGAVFQVGLQYRYKSIYVEAIHEALERRSVGSVKKVNIVEHRIPFLDKVDQWNKFSSSSGGTLVEKCCHYFDLLNLFAQSKPVSLYASGSMAVNFKEFEYEGKKSDILDNASVVINYENGVSAMFDLCMFSPLFYEEVVICGDEGRLKAYEQEDFQPAERPLSYLEVMRGEKQPSRITTPLYPSYIESSGHSGATYYEHVHFVDSMEGKTTNAATVEDGFWSIVVGCAAELSAETGRVIMIDELLKERGIQL